MKFITHVLSTLVLAATLLGSASAAIAAPRQATLSNGSYLFGESKELDQVGQTYMVFSVNQDRLVGGFYSPSSELSCFTGQVENDSLRLAIEDATTQKSYNYAIQLYRPRQVVASAGQGLPSTSSFELQAKHRIQSFDLTSQKVLNTCQTASQF